MTVTLEDMIEKTERMLDIIQCSDAVYDLAKLNPQADKEIIEKNRDRMYETIGRMYINYEAEFFEKKDRYVK